MFSSETPIPSLDGIFARTFATVETSDKAAASRVEFKTQIVPAGGFYVFPPGMAHFVCADEDTIIQLNSIGPWTSTYVNPKDDPQQKAH
jgi:hypothetical protein